MSGSGSCGVGFSCNIHGVKTREVISYAIDALKSLSHRGGIGADGKTGDGAGVLMQLPERFLSREIRRMGSKYPGEGNLAVGVFFLKRDLELEGELEKIFHSRGLGVIGWRNVPTDDSALGISAFKAKPRIRHLLIDTGNTPPARKEIELYLARKAIEKRFSPDIYVPSLSSSVIVYKGMLAATHLDAFYPDLKDPALESAYCIFHQRFSTNTLPEWSMAQPMRTIAHNGEINTIKGNRNWMHSMRQDLAHECFGTDSEWLEPLTSEEESDSSSLDKIIELLMLAGYSPEHAINMCIPPAWENSLLGKPVKSFFEFQSLLMKPWDGPAAVVFAHGTTIGAHLDRNGLRPLRYTITDDGLFLLGSETGMIDLRDRRVKEKGRLGPGETIAVDLSTGEVRYTEEILDRLSRREPYGHWLQNMVLLDEAEPDTSATVRDPVRKQIAFGFTSDEIDPILKTMAESGKEMTWSMGDDTPLPPLSDKPQLLFRYFKQRFSQVTNPPIDPIREKLVMSLRMALGHKKNFLHETGEHARRLLLNSPILLENQIRQLKNQRSFKYERVSLCYEKDHKPETSGKETASEPPLLSEVRLLQREVVAAVRRGAVLLLLSDTDISAQRVAIPSLLAIAASFRALQAERLVNRASLIIETGEARDVHHMACLIGYGASAVHPYLALHTIKDMSDRGVIGIPFRQAALNYKKALEEGLLKVLSRLGIATLNSYYAAGLFDCVCLNREFAEEFFRGTPVTIESDGVAEIESGLLKRHEAGFAAEDLHIDFGGILRHRKGGERHQWSTSSVIALSKFVKSGERRLYSEFASLVSDRPMCIRHLLSFKKAKAIPLEEAEPARDIMKRFFSGAMSVGALSPEAHETIAEACNTLGIRSNSGEGGEDPERYGTIKNSAIKQIASGRFGVTPAYIASAGELEIKIGQGAKPGEGGHLPALKVTRYIAGLRHCNPNTLLISPPPHHDVYSIEDLAQLIHDLREANPTARICVKLVSQAGVGTVAAGVVKCHADIIQICGNEGGTGASPIGSIRNAGDYWETGLAEAHTILIDNGLRDRVTLRVDGGLRTGRDVVIAALLGAEEFGFGTASMVSVGCIMARQCHLNTCPTGVATQDEKLRLKFKGSAAGLSSYFSAVAEETREIMAGMGFRRVEELIGRSDLLEKKSYTDYPSSKRIMVENIKTPPFRSRPAPPRRNGNPVSSVLNDMLEKELLPYIEKSRSVKKNYAITNMDTSIPLRLNYHIAKICGDKGLPPDTIMLEFSGTAGQSFGAFNHNGLSLTLTGDANDYVAKGMFGGRIVVRPFKITDHTQVIVGNTVLYGATGGEFYCAGRAGERFAVRNSGALAVIEGTGHHLCEYMTRGTVIVLGDIGYNAGAGMTGGTIYILDKTSDLESKLDRTYVKMASLEEKSEISELKASIGRFYGWTNSPRAEEILADFDMASRGFRKIVAR